MEIPIKCAKCSRLLDGDQNRSGDFEIELCPDCEKSIREEARKEGYDEGYEDGQKEPTP